MARGLLLTGVTSTESGDARGREAEADDNEDDDDDDEEEDDDDDDDASGAEAGDDDLDTDANAASGDTVNELNDDSVRDVVGETKFFSRALRSRSARSCALM